MSKTLAGVAVSGLLLVLACGCGGARMIYQDQNGGVVAIPSNQNYWPFYYRDEADKLMRAKCPHGYDIVREEEVAVGKVTTNTENTNTETREIQSRRRPGTATATATSLTSETHDKTEYRITFQAKAQ